MARGHRGSLTLRCWTLSFLSTGRLIPALPHTVSWDVSLQGFSSHWMFPRPRSPGGAVVGARCGYFISTLLLIVVFPPPTNFHTVSSVVLSPLTHTLLAPLTLEEHVLELFGIVTSNMPEQGPMISNDPAFPPASLCSTISNLLPGSHIETRSVVGVLLPPDSLTTIGFGLTSTRCGPSHATATPGTATPIAMYKTSSIPALRLFCSTVRNNGIAPLLCVCHCHTPQLIGQSPFLQ
jgi:hypothetical protein